MTRRLQLSLRIIIALLIVALSSWCWYFATRPAPQTVLVLEGGQGMRQPVLPLRSATAKERAAVIRSVIAQLEAFKADRYELASHYQSAALKRQFGSIENFRSTIKRAYPQFANYKAATFGEAKSTQDGQLLDISIDLTGQDGVHVKALYHMTLENNTFRVAGVEMGRASSSPSTPRSPQTPGLVT